MDLNPKQIKQLDDALKSAFPDLDDLERMVLYQFGKNLAEIAEGNNLATVTFRLIKWARSTGCVEALITGAHAENPGNELLERCLREFQPASVPHPQPRIADTTRHTPTQVWGEWQFDMELLVATCKEELLQRYGLFGVVIPFTNDDDENAFRPRFCERLRQIFLRGQTRVRETKAITPKEPLDRCVKLIQRLKPLPSPHEQNTIYPIPVYGYTDTKSTSKVIATFWQLLQETYHAQDKQRLIIVLFPFVRSCNTAGDKLLDDAGSVRIEDLTYPPGIITPGRPRFERWHIQEWISCITMKLNWPEEAQQRWETIMFKQCGNCEPLNMVLLYQHLIDTLELLQDHQTNYQQFLAAIDQRI